MPTDPHAAALEIVLADWVPPAGLSLNGRRRDTWRATWRLSRAAQDRVITAVWDSPWNRERRSRPANPPARAAVTIAFTFPTHRRRDADNLHGRVKPLLDALVMEQLIWDDSTDHIDLTVRAVVEPGVTETRIRIEPLEAT